jgi:3-oxoacyl-[acyl-carrier-protein] synthase II
MNTTQTQRPRSRPSRHRVAVTGIGVMSPAGNSVGEALATLVAGESTAAARPDLAEGGARVHFACFVDALDDVPSFTPRERHRLDRFSKLALAAALDAVRDSDLDQERLAARAGVFVGTGIGGLSWMERAVLDYAHRLDRIPPNSVLRVMNSSPAAHISARLGARGTSMTFSTACASGASAIGEGAGRIRRGELDVVVAGGVDAPLTPLVMSSFAAMRALSRRNDAPREASRPFDDDRDGFVMAEGATFVVLERMDLALARGATVHGEVLGYGSNTDVGHLVAPSSDAVPALASIRLALADAGLCPDDVGHVSAHGTSTVLNDRIEAAALEGVFGSRCPPVTAAKGVVGHMIGAAGAFEAAMGLVCAREGIVPPVANFRCGKDADRIDVVHRVARRIPPAPVLSTSFGFGGQNTCLVLAPTS